MQPQQQQQQPQPYRIRGVNLGGWLVLERYITPSHFAVTECHRAGQFSFCRYPGSYLPASIELCPSTCKALLSTNVFNATDYPMDEWNLAQAFLLDETETDHQKMKNQRAIAEAWFNLHFEHFLKYDDLVQAKQAGITHLRVPLPHWILGNVLPNGEEGEPWIVGDRWKYFRRLIDWCRQIGDLQVWPNIHTAPGSQNGFDNSGIQRSEKTCQGWDHHPEHVQRSLDVIDQVTQQIQLDQLTDVVTGFGLLNEPFGDCNETLYATFIEQGIDLVRSNLGNEVSIFIADRFNADRFNDGKWGLDETRYHDTYLDSHYYYIFDDNDRNKTADQHLQDVCHPSPGQRMDDCCFIDNATKTNPSQGVKRIITEWSGAFDAMPGEVLKIVMTSLFKLGRPALLDRQLSSDRKAFLTAFLQAQIVAYERADINFPRPLNHGWFFWTLKTEGGAYIEWDFLRGIQDGWFPKLAPPNVASERLYGSCEDIAQNFNTTTSAYDNSIIHEYPWGDYDYWNPDHLIIDLNYTEDCEPYGVPLTTSIDNLNRHHSSSSSPRGLEFFLWLALGLGMLRVGKWMSRRQWQQQRPAFNDKYGAYSPVGEADHTSSSSSPTSTLELRV